MKITYLLEDTSLWGGVKLIFEQANRLIERGHEVNIVSKGGQPSWFDLKTQVIQVNRFTDRNVPLSDLVIGTFWTTVLYAHDVLRGIPVHYCQGYEGFLIKTPLLRALIRKAIDYRYRFKTIYKIVITPYLKEFIWNRFGQSAYYIPDGIDLNLFCPGPSRVKEGSTIRILVVGPIEVKLKGISPALKAVKLVKKRGYGIELVRVSQYPMGKKEKSIGTTDEYHFQVPPNDMPEIYRSCDIFIGSSIGKEEAFSLPAIEAMACGLPCLFTDIPCFKGYDDKGNYAIFVPPNDPEKMAEGLIELIEDTARRDDLRDRGLKVASNFNWSKVIEIVEDTFAKIYVSGTQKEPKMAELAP